MFDWNDIAIFLAVAAEGSTLGASKTLGMNQTTVSRRIQTLEHTLGLTLFERDTRGFTLTAQGKGLLADAALGWILPPVPSERGQSSLRGHYPAPFG